MVDKHQHFGFVTSRKVLQKEGKKTNGEKWGVDICDVKKFPPKIVRKTLSFIFTFFLTAF